MPIGKNSIKRVQNNGYSAVKTAAPDMENSTVVAAEPEKSDKNVPVSKKSVGKTKAVTAKKSAKTTDKDAKKKAIGATDKKKATGKPVAKTSPTEKAAAAVAQTVRVGDGYVNLGGNMPYYLL